MSDAPETVATGEPRVVGARSFDRLEDAFVRALEELPDEMRRRCWVVVPTNLLSLHLRRLAAARTSGLLGTRFLILKDAAWELARSGLAAGGLRPVPAGAQELVLRRLLQERPADSYFGGLPESPNTSRALLRAIRRLKDCLWSPAALRTAASRLGKERANAAGKLQELALIWEGLAEWQEQQRFYDARDVLAEAAYGASEPASAPDALVLYGFYDLTPLQARVVRRLSELSSGGRAFLLWSGTVDEPAPGYEYAAPTVRFLVEVLGGEGVRCLEQDSPRTDLEVLREGVFADRGGCAEPPGGARQTELRDGSVRILSCPGEFPEAVEVTRQVVGAFRQRGDLDSSGVGVLLRSAEGTAENLRETFDRAGLKLCVREGLPLSNTVPGRILLSLFDLAGEGADRSDLIHFLSLADVTWPEGLSATALDRLSRGAGITGHPARWVDRLRHYARALTREADRAETESDAQSARREAQLSHTAAGFLKAFVQELSALAGASEWSDLADRAESLLDRFIPPEAEGAEGVQNLVSRLRALETAGTRAGTEPAAWLMERWLRETSLRTSKFQFGGVSVSTVMGSRGATYDIVMVPGLCEKAFPARIVGDPILNEPDRGALNEHASSLSAGFLPRRRRRPEEERYLFNLVLASAREGVVLCYPRIEEHTGRPRMASRFLVKACRALTGHSGGAGTLEESFGRPLVTRVPAEQASVRRETGGPALDLREHDLRVFGRAGGGMAGAAYTEKISRFFARALRLRKLRWGRAEFGPFDGKIRSEQLLDHLRERTASRFGRMSPSQLETYARCPFSYFLHYMLDVQEVEEPTEEFAVTALDRGRVIHALLHRVFRGHLEGRRFGDLDGAECERILACARDVIDETAEALPSRMPATWAAEREDILDQVRDTLDGERERSPDAAPHLFEHEFGRDESPPLDFDLGDDTTVGFSGRIDRVDLQGESAFRVIDYKSGSSRRYREDSFAGGTQLQLPIYLLAGRRATGRGDGCASYLFVGQNREMTEFTLQSLDERRDNLRRLLRLIVRGIRGGNFFMLPAEDNLAFCRRYCEYRTVCGMARVRLAEIKYVDAALKPLRDLRGIE